MVYSQVDGDQHGLMIGWVAWLRSLGLEVLCAGKARDGEVAFKDDFFLGPWRVESELRDFGPARYRRDPARRSQVDGIYSRR